MVNENKALFVKKLHRVLSQYTREYSDISDMSYVTDGFDEHVYVTFDNGAQRRINVSCDSCSGILKDFIKNIHNSSYDTRKRYKPEPPKKSFFEDLEDTFTVEQINEALEFLVSHNIASEGDNEETKSTIRQLFKMSCDHLNDEQVTR